MLREANTNSCDAVIRVSESGQRSVLPCQLLGQGVCLKDKFIVLALNPELAFGNCAADTADGIQNKRKQSPLDRSIQIILDRAAKSEAEHPESIGILLPYKSAIIAIAGAPDKTAERLRAEILDSEPKTNRFIAAVVDRVQNRFLSGLASIRPEHREQLMDESEAISGGSEVMMLMGLAVEPDNVIQYAEMMSATDTQPLPWEGIREVRQRLRKDHLGSHVLRDLVDEYRTPGSKFRASPFGHEATPIQAAGAVASSMMYDAYMAVGVAKGLAPRPQTR